MGSFWGTPQYKPHNKEVARFLEQIRELTENISPQRGLLLATAAMTAIAAFITTQHGPRETLAILDQIKTDITSE